MKIQNDIKHKNFSDETIDEFRKQAAQEALPVRLERLFPAEILGEAVVRLGVDAVRPLVEEADGILEAAAELRDRGPWWLLLSESLNELCRDDINYGWNLLCDAVNAIAQVEIEDRLTSDDR